MADNSTRRKDLYKCENGHVIQAHWELWVIQNPEGELTQMDKRSIGSTRVHAFCPEIQCAQSIRSEVARAFEDAVQQKIAFDCEDLQRRLAVSEIRIAELEAESIMVCRCGERAIVKRFADTFPPGHGPSVCSPALAREFGSRG